MAVLRNRRINQSSHLNQNKRNAHAPLACAPQRRRRRCLAGRWRRRRRRPGRPGTGAVTVTQIQIQTRARRHRHNRNAPLLDGTLFRRSRSCNVVTFPRVPGPRSAAVVLVLALVRLLHPAQGFPPKNRSIRERVQKSGTGTYLNCWSCHARLAAWRASPLSVRMAFERTASDAGSCSRPSGPMTRGAGGRGVSAGAWPW